MSQHQQEPMGKRVRRWVIRGAWAVISGVVIGVLGNLAYDTWFAPSVEPSSAPASPVASPAPTPRKTSPPTPAPTGKPTAAPSSRRPSTPKPSVRPTRKPTTTKTSSATVQPPPPPPTTGDVIKNWQLAVSPIQVRRAAASNVLIEVDDASPNTFMDVEIAAPASDRGGVCPTIERTAPCDLVYSGGGRTDASGKARIVYPWRANNDAWDFPPGDYVITVQDRHTGGVLSGVRFTVID